MLTSEEFAKLTLREMHEYLERIRTAIILSALDKGEFTQPVDVDTIPDGDGLADAVDAWLASGGAA